MYAGNDGKNSIRDYAPLVKVSQYGQGSAARAAIATVAIRRSGGWLDIQRARIDSRVPREGACRGGDEREGDGGRNDLDTTQGTSPLVRAILCHG